MNNLRSNIFNAFINKDIAQLTTINGNLVKSIHDSGSPLKEDFLEAAILLSECTLELNLFPILQTHFDVLYSIAQHQSLASSGVVSPIPQGPPPGITRKLSIPQIIIERKITYKRENIIRIYLLRIGLLLKTDERITERLNEVVEHIAVISQLLSIIPKLSAKVHFLVFNASVLAWKLIQKHYVDGHRAQFVSFLETICATLEETNDSNYDWRVRLIIELMKGYEEVNKPERLNKIARTAFSLSISSSAPAFASHTDDLLRLNISLNTTNYEFLHKLKNDVNASPLFKAICIAQQLQLTIFKDKTRITNEVEEALEFLEQTATESRHEKNINNTSFKDKELEIRAEIYFLSVSLKLSNFFEAALANAQSVLDSRQSQNIRCKAYSEFTLCQLTLHNEETKKDATPDSLRPFRVHALKKLNTLLELLHRCFQTSNAKFLIPLIEQNSIMIWNVGLHFIHPQYRKHILKPFNRAASALEFINSNLKELRSQLHYEIAVCEVEVEEVLSKGKIHVEKALKLSNNAEYSRFFLEPFKQRVELKLLMYSEPEIPLQQVILFIEKAKESQSKEISRDLLSKTISLFSTIGEVSQPDFSLWEQIVLIAKKMELWDLFYQGCGKALEALNNVPSLSTRSEKASLGLKVIYSLKSRIHILIGQQNEIQTGFTDSFGLASQDPVRHYLIAVQIGVNLKDDRITSNAILCIYNRYRSSFSTCKFIDCVQSFTECFNAITQLPSLVEESASLVLAVCDALLRGLEQIHYQKKEAPMIVVLSDSKMKPKPTQGSFEFTSEFKSADEVGKFSLNLNVPSHLKFGVARTQTRLNFIRGITTLPKISKDLQLIMILELLKISPDADSKKKESFTRGCEILLEETEERNQEICVSYAIESIARKNYEHAKIFVNRILGDIEKIPESERLGNFWISKVEMVMGQLHEISIENSHSQSSQNQLREAAIEHYVKACEYGFSEPNEEQRKRVVHQAAQAFWNISIPFMKSKMSRHLLLFPLQDVTQCLSSVGDSHFEFQVKLFGSLFLCLKDQRLWEQGFYATQDAFEILPKEYHRKLWKWKILFMRSMNKNVSLGMFTLKDRDDLLQAEVYAIAARSSSKESEETKVYFKKAIDSAYKSNSMQSRYLLEYAEWIIQNGSLSQKNEAIQSVQLAIDKLISQKLSTIPIKDLHTLGRSFLFLHLHTQPKEGPPEFLLLSHQFYHRMLINSLKNQTLWKPEDWIHFELSQDQRTHIQNSHSELELNSKSIQNPFHILHFIHLVIENLLNHEYVIHCIPLYHLVGIITGDILRSTPLQVTKEIVSITTQVLNLLEMAKLFRSLQLNTLCDDYILKAEEKGLKLTQEVKTKHREEVRQREYLNFLAQKREERFTANPVRTRTAATRGSTRSQRIDTSDETLASDETSIRWIWMLQAENLISLEQMTIAKELIWETLFHSQVFVDRRLQSRSKYLLSLIYYYEDDIENSIQTLTESLNGSSQSLDFWKKWIFQMTDLLILKGNIQAGRHSLIRSIETLKSLISKTSENGVRRASYNSLLETLAFLELKFSSINMRVSDSQSSFVETLHHLDQAIHSFKELHKWRDYCESQQQKSSLLIQYPKYFGGERKALTEALKCLELARSEIDKVSENVYRPGSFSIPIFRILGMICLEMSKLYQKQTNPLKTNKKEVAEQTVFNFLLQLDRDINPTIPEYPELLNINSAYNLTKESPSLLLRTVYVKGQILYDQSLREVQKPFPPFFEQSIRSWMLAEYLFHSSQGSLSSSHVLQLCTERLIEALGRVPNTNALRTNSHTTHLPRSYYLALLQSCQSQSEFLEIYKKESPMGDIEKLYYQLIGDDFAKNYDWRSSQSQIFINSSPMWKLVSIDLSMEEMFKQIPKKSLDKTKLFGALFGPETLECRFMSIPWDDSESQSLISEFMQKIDIATEEEQSLSFSNLENFLNNKISPLFADSSVGKQKNQIVLLIDSSLSQLPFECISLFSSFTFRDFSFHFYCWRFLREMVRQKPPVKKKVTYIIDPSNLAKTSKGECFGEYFLQKQGRKTSWDGVVGSDHFPTPEELQNFIANSNVLAYFGVNSMFGELSPKFITVLDLQETSIAIEFSQQRWKPKNRNRELDSFWTAALLSLRGVSVVFTNHWNFQSNRYFIESMDELSAGSVSNLFEFVPKLQGKLVGERKLHERANLVVYGILPSIASK